jgi:hypothetical protein
MKTLRIEPTVAAPTDDNKNRMQWPSLCMVAPKRFIYSGIQIKTHRFPCLVFHVYCASCTPHIDCTPYILLKAQLQGTPNTGDCLCRRWTAAPPPPPSSTHTFSFAKRHVQSVSTTLLTAWHPKRPPLSKSPRLLSAHLFTQPISRPNLVYPPSSGCLEDTPATVADATDA